MSQVLARKLLVVVMLFSVAGIEVGESQTDARAIRVQQETINSRLPQPTSETSVTWIGQSSLRIDSEIDSSGAPLVSTIFRRGGQGFLILLHESEEALVYDREQVNLMALRRQKIQERLAELSADDPNGAAAMIIRMQEERKKSTDLNGAEPKASTGLEKTSEKGELEGTAWVKYREVRDELVTREFQVTPWDQFSIGEGIVGVFEDLERFIEDAQEISTATARLPNPFELFLQLGGFPIASRWFDEEGNTVLETRLTSVEVIEDADSVFENPGYPERGVTEDLPEVESTP